MQNINLAVHPSCGNRVAETSEETVIRRIDPEQIKLLTNRR